ncbi:MAG TPA: hypothetical protein VG842_10765 [Sediminibacterium sp.]|nr:hypothetical protein [Sediminibacterium sp.]
MPAFPLYLLIHTETALRYPYVLVDGEGEQLILVAKQQVLLARKADLLFYLSDYLPTSRQVDFDLPFLLESLRAYTGFETLRLCVRFGQIRHTTITYHSPVNEAPKDYDIYAGYPDEKARRLLNQIYPLFLRLRRETFKG